MSGGTIQSLLAAVMIAGLSTSALAEPPMGSRLGSRERDAGTKLSEAASAKQAHGIADCMVVKRKNAVEHMLSATDVTTMQKAHDAIWSDDLTCNPDESDNGFVAGHTISWSTDLLRGMLAEELLRRRSESVARLPALAFRQGRYERTWFALTERNATVDEMGACLADTTPPGIAALLKTVAYSPEERQAFGALTPMMGQCLVVGAKLTGNRQALRAAFADALYQRLINPAASTPPLAETAKK
jgi:hypothetical protein